ncbi:MAG TPA: hypothetical protein VHM19_03130, partial [Polyangiales bacterium]|nr:hypothetical protein [Polyangiales bacterium]
MLFVIALLGACSALAPARARAWTDTTVTQVSASLDTTQPTTRVQLAVSVHVTGGWITRFEMTGLDEDFTLAPDAPPVFETPAGERFVPEAMRGKEAGALDLVFADRHAAPHRGDYVLRLVYTTDAPLRAATHLDARTLRLRWRLPTWSVSLANVHVDIVAPHGTRPAADGGIDDALGDASVTPLDAARTQIALLRAHLPRGQVLEVA